MVYVYKCWCVFGIQTEKDVCSSVGLLTFSAKQLSDCGNINTRKLKRKNCFTKKEYIVYNIVLKAEGFFYKKKTNQHYLNHSR